MHCQITSLMKVIKCLCIKLKKIVGFQQFSLPFPSFSPLAYFLPQSSHKSAQPEYLNTVMSYYMSSKYYTLYFEASYLLLLHGGMNENVPNRFICLVSALHRMSRSHLSLQRLWNLYGRIGKKIIRGRGVA